jgi:hypothetical protein
LIQIAEFNAPDWLSDAVNLPKGKRWTIEKGDGGVHLNLAHPGIRSATMARNHSHSRN